tara:strand:- start:311 stop:1900 length:1590 start_codon:yes stop_codon:yes gene_type:complete
MQRLLFTALACLFSVSGFGQGDYEFIEGFDFTQIDLAPQPWQDELQGATKVTEIIQEGDNYVVAGIIMPFNGDAEFSIYMSKYSSSNIKIWDSYINIDEHLSSSQNYNFVEIISLITLTEGGYALSAFIRGNTGFQSLIIKTNEDGAVEWIDDTNSGNHRYFLFEELNIYTDTLTNQTFNIYGLDAIGLPRDGSCTQPVNNVTLPHDVQVCRLYSIESPFNWNCIDYGIPDDEYVLSGPVGCNYESVFRGNDPNYGSVSKLENEIYDTYIVSANFAVPSTIGTGIDAILFSFNLEQDGLIITPGFQFITNNTEPITNFNIPEYAIKSELTNSGNNLFQIFDGAPLGGGGYDKKPRFIEVSQTGEVILETSIDTDISNHEQDFIPLQDGSWLSLSRIDDSNKPASLRKYSSNGDIIWSKKLPGNAVDMDHFLSYPPIHKIHIHSDNSISILWNRIGCNNAGCYGWSYLTRFVLEDLEQQEQNIFNTVPQQQIKKVVKVLDALGREVNHTTNQILFHIYDDGSVEKKFIVE